MIPWTVACQVPLSMGFSRQEYWSGLPFPSPGDLPDPGIKPRSPALQADDLPPELWGKPQSRHPPPPLSPPSQQGIGGRKATDPWLSVQFPPPQWSSPHLTFPVFLHDSLIETNLSLQGMTLYKRVPCRPQNLWVISGPYLFLSDTEFLQAEVSCRCHASGIKRPRV